MLIRFLINEIFKRTHAHMNACMHACTHAHTHTRTRSHTHTHAHAPTHTHRPVIAIIDVNVKQVVGEAEQSRVYDDVCTHVERYQPIFLHVEDANNTNNNKLDQQHHHQDDFYQNFISQNNIGRPNLAKYERATRTPIICFLMIVQTKL